MTIQKAQQLINEVNKMIDENEYNTVTYKGVKNLSRADLDTLVFYAEIYIRNGGNFNSLTEPYGNLALILEKANLL